jgi:hypothetical protein
MQVGLKEVAVSTQENMLGCLMAGLRARTTAATSANAASSRSHAILTFRLRQVRGNAILSIPSLAQSRTEHLDRPQRLPEFWEVLDLMHTRPEMSGRSLRMHDVTDNTVPCLTCLAVAGAGGHRRLTQQQPGRVQPKDTCC